MATGDFEKSRNLLARKRLAKRESVRRILLESLESRQLMAVGPTLVGIQPNEGDLLENGEVLQVSPKELVFRFDDAVGIDADTLSGIRVVRSGTDGVFERASVATDLGTNGQSLVEFYARDPGESGNGLAVRFTAVSRVDTRLPKITTSGRIVNIELNSNPQLPTRVQDIVQSLPIDGGGLVYALRLRGSDTIAVASTVNLSQDYVLNGANTAKASTDFGLGNAVSVQFLARESGNNGLGIKINVTSRDRGGAGNPIVTVTGKTVNVELNSNSRFPTTMQEFVSAINSSNSLSSSLIEAKIVSGAGSIRIGTQAITYSPIALTGVSDIEIVPGYIGLGSTGREVVLRFAEALPQDQYRIEIIGQGTRALLNSDGEAFNGGVSRSVAFSLALGARVESVVPQPVSRNASGVLTQQRNQIDLYFNSDALIDLTTIASINGVALANFQQLRTPFFIQSSDTITLKSGATFSPTVLDANFYQLFYTSDTLNSTDDQRFLPSAIRYFPDANRVSLIFSRNLEELQNPANGPALPITDMRLRVGTNEAAPLPPVTVNTLAVDPGDTFSNTTNLSTWTPGAGGSQSILINSEITNVAPFTLDFPGGSDEPGNRQNRYQDNLRLTADSVDGISTLYYNFQGNLGTVGSSPLLNAITEQQKQRVREVMSLYERYLGIRFVETASLGMTIAVGDMRAITPFPDIVGSAIPGVQDQNAAGGIYYEAGNLVNGQAGTVLDIQDFSNATLNEFGGSFQRAAMQAVGRLLGMGLSDEVEGFTVQSFSSAFVPGVGSDITLPGDVDIVHGQYLYRPDSTDIDLYQFTLPTSGQISIEAFAERMSSASLLDTSIRLYHQNDLGQWEEVAFNDDYYSSDSFVQLNLEKGNYIVGVSASGNNTYDPVVGNTGLGGRSQGQYQLRMDFKPPAAGELKDGSGQSVDGDADGASSGVFNFWFRPAGTSNTKFVDKAAVTGGTGTLLSPFRNIRDALTAAQPGDVVRIVGNAGADGSMATLADNLAYEIGFNSLGQALPDGSTFDVPKGVSVMIDAGAILKMRRARVGVGSSSASVDRSGGSLLVLGTPKLITQAGTVVRDATGEAISGNVYFTSASDTTIGKNANAAVVGITPAAGDWGGIDFRTRVDAADGTRVNNEAQGQFLNWVAHADLRYGGGQVVVDGLSQIVTPIQMIDARPTIGHSIITNSSDAAMSATPNSFLETNFNSPAEQVGAVTPFSVDYDRVGPAIYFNKIVNNSVNGLQVRIRTASGTQLESMTIPGRFDDTDIVHFLPENLVVAGSAGGFKLANEAPASTAVTLQFLVTGSLPAGTYNYKFTRVVGGIESAASEATVSLSTFANGSVQLRNLPVGITKIYRSSANGTGPYVQVPYVANTTNFIDNGTSLATTLPSNLERYTAQLDGRLVIDAGTIVKSQGSRIELSNGGQLIAEGSAGNPIVFTSFLDNRYGAGGTFRTSSSRNSDVSSGDWGGIYVGPTSSASIDHAVIAYGGGTTRIEGGFADFNAVEVRQGDLRLTNSTIENNAAGSSTSTVADRAGRGSNAAGTVYVLGSQPVIAGNKIQSNEGAAININANSLNYEIVSDLGRSRGAIDRVESIGNHGPLITGNRLASNQTNGMVVRGGVMTTEGVWDDTDIVHVVTSDIKVSDFNHYGGLRLMSKANQSLVVKLEGAAAGFTAGGLPLDNANRIGGSVQLIGLPGFPVIVTSIKDDTVGAGFKPDGTAQTDTNNDGDFRQPGKSGALGTKVVIDSTTNIANDLRNSLLGNGITAVGNATFVGSATSAGFFSGGGSSIGIESGVILTSGDANLAAGPNKTDFSTGFASGVGDPALDALTGFTTRDTTSLEFQFQSDGGELFFNFVFASEEYNEFANSSFNDVFAFFVDGANIALIPGTTTPVTINNINGGNPFGTNAQNPQFFVNNEIGTGLFNDEVEYDGFTQVFTARSQNLGPGVHTIKLTISDAGDTALDSAVFLELGSFSSTIVGTPPKAGDWRSVMVDTFSNDRNVATTGENESTASLTVGNNNGTQSAQFLGALASSEKNGDENQRLGFHIMGSVSSPSDVDVYSFTGIGGSEVWLDIDETENSLDTVLELVDADGRTLALSNNSVAEEANPTLLFKSTDMPQDSVNPLRKSPTELYYTSATGAPKDLYSTNPRDAGMRVTLPGAVGASNLYHVRVRSSSLKDGDSANNLLLPSSIGNGLTKGSYVLQMRLRETDEIPGSGINYADIRYATNGLELRGVPGNSPLLGETGEVEPTAVSGPNNTFATAQYLGNLLKTNAQAISVAGNLATTTDVDWFSFDVNYDRITPTNLRQYFATVFDMDYAAGLGRPDTSVYVFDANGNLILGGLTSGLVDDLAGPLAGADNSDLSRGSASALDPFIGSYELTSGRYFVAVTNSNMVPAVLATYSNANASPLVRLQPIDSLQLIAEDHIGFSGGSTGGLPVTPVLFDDSTKVQYDLSDVVLYVTQDVGQSQTNVYLYNPFTGEIRNQLSRGAYDIQDIAMRTNSTLQAFDRTYTTPGGADTDAELDYITINTNTGVFTESSVTYETFHVDVTANPPAAVAANDGWNPEAIVFADIANTERGFMVANRPTPFGVGQTYTDPISGAVFSTTNVTPTGGLSRPGVTQFTNVVFEFNPNTGAAVSSISNPGARKTGLATATGPGTDIFERGRIETFTLDNQGNPVTRSTQLVTKEATKIVGSQINRLLRDGDIFTVIDSFNFRTRFEFDFGPEVQIVDHTRVTDGMQFTLDGVVYEFDNSVGAPTVSLGSTPVKLTAGQSLTQFVDAIRNAMPSSITVGFEGGRLNFSGASTGSFTQLQAAGALFSLGTNGSVGAGNVPVKVLANDTADTIAARIVQAVNSLNVPGLSATATGTTIQFFGVQVESAGPLFLRGIGPGGIITGTAWIGNTMFAVSDEGGLYTVSAGELNSYGGTRNIGSYVASSYELRGIQFTALTNGPTLNNGGQLTQILFGLDVNGNMYAFDTTGRLQPVFANGATSVSTGITGANGLAFSTLTSNLWHQSTRRGTDAGHGIEPTGNNSRNGMQGGTSYYFGRENVGNYDLPGGAAGAMESKTVSLAGVTAGDLPMLYFNYFLATEGASSDLGVGDTAADYMRDSFRVYISGDDGQWTLAATNNDPTQSGSNAGLLDDEFDPLLTGNDSVQPLFDNTGSWRQARVSLADFAGQENVKIRIEFASAGSFGYGNLGGKGPEIRTIAGDKLVDGQSFTINGQNFEIEMGPSLSMPSGSAILDGDFVRVDGTKYVFTSGTTVVSAPDVAVPYTSSMTAAQLATALSNAITSNPPVITTISGLSYTNEANDLTSQAEDTGIFGQSQRVVGTGAIGDNLALVDGTRDVDFVRIDVDRGSVVNVDVRAAILGSTLDSYLRVFDSEGRPLSINGTLVQNDNGAFNSTDSSLSFIAPKAGTYYIAVSSSGNSTYNANVSGSTTAGLSTGNYTLEVQVRRNLVPIVDGNRLQLSGAADVQLGAPNIQLQGSLGTTGVPLYLTVDMTAAEVATEMQRVIADYFASGITSAYPVRGGDTISLTGLTVTDAGPFGLTTSFTGDLFSAYNSGTNFQGQTPNSGFPGSLQSQANTAEGVYVDDFIIGLAGRGELVTGGTNGNTAFIQDPSFALSNPDQVNGEVLVGPYQLEIRGGQESGTPDLNGLIPSIILDPGLTIDSRLSSGISVQFRGSTSFVAGTTFTLSAGPKVLTFELDDENDGIAVQAGNIAIPFNTMVVDPLTGARVADTAQVIAARFRDIVNSSAVQTLLAGAVSATLLNGDRTGATSDTVVLVGGGDVQIPSSVGTRIVSDGKGGSNRERRQGQVVVNAAKISNSLSFGASITSAPRDALTGASIPGTPRNTVTINNELLTPGAVIMNSQFLFNVAGGINVVGDAGGANLPTAAVPFVRLVNNTIVGGTVTTLTNTVSTIENGFVFEDGNLAFADRVSAYNVGSPLPLTGLQVSADALGAPNYSGTGEPIAGQGAVSLGRGGQITLQFTDNFLTGSNNSDADLVIFEVGDSEEVFVEVSADNINWTNVGRASAASPTIDLDAFGFSANSRLVYVRLSDVINQGALSGDSVGADIDSVGAISSVPADKYAPRGLGISVTRNATATLLNNVLVNNATGVNVDNSSNSTVIGGSVYQFNTNDVGGAANVGQFPLVLPATVPLFISPGTGNLYPNLASPVIDSTIDSLKDRASLVAVKQPLGIAASPILAPQFDINGQLRVDDPTVETPAGLGESVFKDRGAQERADFVGPSVALQNPVDNDVAGLDQNQDPTIVELVGTTPEYFDIRLIDGLEPSDPNRGSGIDNSTVSSASVLVYRNDQPLVEGVDYRFGYDSTNGVIRLQSLAGIWKGQSEYTIRFVNSKESAIVAKKGSQYRDGAQFQIIDAASSLTKFELDLGYLISIPVSNGNSALVDGATFTIDDGAKKLTFEIDTNLSINSGNIAVRLASDLLTDATTAMVTAINGAGLNLTASRAADGLIQLQSSASVVFDRLSSNLTVTGSTGVQKAFGLQIPLLAGVPQGIIDGQTFTINRGSGPVTFELDTNNNATSGNVPVRFSASATAAQIGLALVSAINGSTIGLSPVYDGNGIVRLGGDSNTVLGLTQTVLTQVGVAGEPASVRIAIPYNAAATEVAALIRSAIEGAGLTGLTLTSFGSRLVVGNAIAVSGEGAGVIGSIRDMAGNTLKPNQVDGSTTLTVFLGEGLDYGDAPSPYLSTDVNNGPRHKVVTGLSLGATATSDTDARLPNSDLDDGVTFSAVYAAFSSSAQIAVNNTTGSTAFVKMWIDYNGDGVFATNEVITNITINGSGNRTVNFTVPTTAKSGPTYVRVRLSTDQASVNLPTGSSPDGEVEDYLINLQGNPFTNGAWNLDVTQDGFVTPIDALNVINWLNNPAKPKLLTLADATFAKPFVDVNGDGRVTASDALLIIDYLNSRPATGEGESDGSNMVGGNMGQWSSQETVLASNWAASLFSSPSNAKPASSPVVTNDLVFSGGDLLEAPELTWQSNSQSDQVWADFASQTADDAGVDATLDDLLGDILA